jgi:hypothetical protein
VFAGWGRRSLRRLTWLSDREASGNRPRVTEARCCQSWTWYRFGRGDPVRGTVEVPSRRAATPRARPSPRPPCSRYPEVRSPRQKSPKTVRVHRPRMVCANCVNLFASWSAARRPPSASCGRRPGMPETPRGAPAPFLVGANGASPKRAERRGMRKKVPVHVAAGRIRGATNFSHPRECLARKRRSVSGWKKQRIQFRHARA